MSTIAKENENLTAASKVVAPSNGSPEAPKAQPVALEIPVTVNGARTIEGSDKREPFSESTKTVLVFGNGAVIRLASSVAAGQLLFLTNEKTKKEVVCQVVKSKNYRNVSGYVELEFTEQIVGFWGMRFPGDRIGPVATGAAAPPARPVIAAVPPAAKVEPPVAKPVLQVPAPVAAAPVSAPVVPVAPTQKIQPADIATVSPNPPTQKWGDVFNGSQTTPPAAPSVTPNGAQNGQRRSSDVKNVTPANGIPAEPAKVDNAALQAQIQNFLAPKADASTPLTTKPEPVIEAKSVAPVVAPPAKVVEISQPKAQATVPALEPLPSKLSKSLTTGTLADDEETKIPAWLEPLARNAAAPVSTQELLEREKARRHAEQVASEEHSKVDEELPSAQIESHEREESSVPAPTFGNTLRIDEASSPAKSGSKKLLVLAIIAACLTMAAAGTWYLRRTASQNQTPSPATSAAVTAPSQQVVAPPANSASITPPAIAPANSAPANTRASVTSPVQNQTVSTIPVSSVTPIPSSRATNPAAAPAAVAPDAQASAKRPGFGQVRLASPTVKGSASSAENLDPGMNLGSANPGLGGSDALTSNLGSSAGPKQPSAAAALPVGGVVRPAKLINSIQPIYPALAKSQHISGNVQVDALIDASGRVSTMKVVSGPTALQQAAMDALRQWKYQPETLDGKAVPMHLTVTIQFRLQQ